MLFFICVNTTFVRECGRGHARNLRASKGAASCSRSSIVEEIPTDVARLAFRVRRARLDRDRDGLLVFFVGVVLLRVTAAVYFLTTFAAAAPVVMLASGVTVPRV